MEFRLFRQEAIDHASRRLSGEVILATPLGFRVIAFTLLACLLAAAVFASLATYARRQSVEGVIAPRSGLVRTVARQGGRVVALNVKVGDRVSAGQPIARLSLAQTTASGDTSLASVETLELERSAARSSHDSSLNLLQQERLRLINDVSSLSSEVEEAERRLALQESQLQLAQAEAERAQSIADRGFLPKREVEVRRSAALASESAVSGARSTIIGLRRQLNQARQAVAEQDQRIALLASETRRTLAVIGQRGVDLDARSSAVVIAPVDGVVAALPARLGMELSAGAAAAIIAPSTAGSDLVAEVLIPSRASAFLQPGQSVRIGVDAFPYERYGKIGGVLMEVSRVPLQPDDLKLFGLQGEEPFYRGVVVLQGGGVRAYGRTSPLRPGMTLTADIVIDRRSLIEWLFDPLYAAARR